MTESGTSINLVDHDGTRLAVNFGQSPMWQLAMDWARFHGMDPMRIPAGSIVERDPEHCEIRYEEFVFDSDGLPLIVEDEPVVVRKVERGEAPPLPFPVDLSPCS